MFGFQLCERGVWGRFPEGRLYERKLDGTRALAIKLEDKVKLINRRGFVLIEITELLTFNSILFYFRSLMRPPARP